MDQSIQKNSLFNFENRSTGREGGRDPHNIGRAVRCQGLVHDTKDGIASRGSEIAALEIIYFHYLKIYILRIKVSKKQFIYF